MIPFIGDVSLQKQHLAPLSKMAGSLWRVHQRVLQPSSTRCCFPEILRAGCGLATPKGTTTLYNL